MRTHCSNLIQKDIKFYKLTIGALSIDVGKDGCNHQSHTSGLRHVYKAGNETKQTTRTLKNVCVFLFVSTHTHATHTSSHTQLEVLSVGLQRWVPLREFRSGATAVDLSRDTPSPVRTPIGCPGAPATGFGAVSWFWWFHSS
jgi:hypothetical protein